MANNTSTQTILSERLAEARLQKGYTQQQIAEFLGCNRATVTNYENGKRTPDIDTIVKLTKLYEVSADYLLGLAKQPTTEPPSQGQAVSEDNSCTNSERYNVRTLCELLDLQEDKQFTILELLGYAEHKIFQLTSDKEALLASQGVLLRHISDLEKKNSELDKALDEFYN